MLKRQVRCFSSLKSVGYPRTRPFARPLQAPIESTTETGPVPTETKTVPWFMQYNKQFDHASPARQAPIPAVPASAPPILSPLLTYLVQDLILQDIKLLDLRQRENPWGDDCMMILCTAQSERQLRSSAESLKGYLRKHGGAPRIEGLVNWENTKVKRRRRRKMLGKASYQVDDDRLRWIFIDAGKSGLILQLFTEQGRDEIQLEELWQKRVHAD
ncbi:hypothetical protein BCR37DRAFT_393195 [Protomyces lactucae-debilis]|uniref:ATPase synthesis protein 25 n=1 Tax=Protomyces lactucae-debilis TaxID=2754530 RepID=A0A1Y2FEQ0_PROLT|nr:uncharacterized protein BCR37DRAFT_393195 [Protomyces lactucae-debilis]ORY81315.1 hypothetical protein BCR37DRAFT_393195 [Protomyces lactucae-debilis]